MYAFAKDLLNLQSASILQPRNPKVLPNAIKSERAILLNSSTLQNEKFHFDNRPTASTNIQLNIFTNRENKFGELHFIFVIVNANKCYFILFNCEKTV